MNTEKDLEYLLREGIIQTQADLDDYLKLHSTKTTRKGKSTAARTREYAMKLSDIQAQLGGVTGLTTNTVGMSVYPNGDGTWTVNYAGGSSVQYSNVLFVDNLKGNNATAQPGRFDLPYSTVSQAAAIAATLSANVYSRVMVYIRSGLYSGSVNLANYVDFYSEPGVVFFGSGNVRDLGVAVTSNFLGYAKFVGKSSQALFITGNSTVNFQFDYIDNTSGQSIRIEPPVGGQCEVLIEGNKIFCTTLGVAYAIAIRRKATVTMNIKSWIWAYHSVFDIRDNFDGLLTVNCPRIRLANDNIYGGNFKQAFIIYTSTAASKIIVNGDIVNEMTGFIGGIAGMVTYWGAAAGYFELNGNIYGGQTYGLYCSGNQPTGTMVINGSIYSDIQPVWVSSYSNCYVRNGVIMKKSTAAGATVALNQFSKLFLSNTFVYNAQVDGDLIYPVDTTNEVNLYNVVGQSEGVGGFAINSANPVTVKVHGSRFNKALGATITDALTPSGFINDPLVVVPKF